MSEGVKQSQLYESLSALVDNEATELEVHRLLAESEKDGAVRTRWYRYQLVRSALQGDAIFHSAADLSDSIRTAIANLSFDEAETPDGVADVQKAQATAQPLKRKLPSYFGRAAIAASVAFVALIGVQQYNAPGLNQQQTPAMAEASSAQQPIVPTIVPASNSPFAAANLQTVSRDLTRPAASPVASQGSTHLFSTEQSLSDDEKIRLYLQQLMIEHAEHSSQNSNTGMLPFVRVPVER